MMIKHFQSKKSKLSSIMKTPFIGISPILPGDEGDDDRDEIFEKMRKAEEELFSQNREDGEAKNSDGDSEG